MKKKTRLTWILFAAFLLITVVSLAVSGGYAFWAMRDFFYKHSALALEARGQLIKTQIIEHIVPGNRPLIDAICKTAGTASKSRITVISTDGTVLGDSYVNPDKMDNHANRPEIQSALEGKTATRIRFSTTMQKKMMYVALPVHMNNRIRGVVRTSLAVTTLENQILAIRNRILFAGVLIFLAAAGISLWVSRRISMPIEAMKNGADRFAAGDLDYRLPVAHTDEMAGLADAMNRMARQLRKRMIDVTRQHNEIEAILASMQEGLIALDPEERVIKMNQPAREILGVSWEPGKKPSILELVRNRDLEQLIQQVLSTETPAEKDIAFHRNGERVIHVHGSPIYGAGKKRVGTLLMLNDVTQLRRLENIRQDFAANVSHELKTPLTAVKGFVETLIHGPHDDTEGTKRFLGIIEKHVNRLDAIIEDLMTLSRIEESGETQRIGKQAHRIDEVLEKAVELRRPEAEAKQIRIELNCQDAPRMKMDAILFEQAAANILDNAVKYSPEGSVIRIESRLEASGLVIAFKDEGIGIEKKHLPRLFERFYRVDRARSRKLGGTGLGLAIVKHIVQAHGGRIFVESTPGKGSTFTLHFPHPELEPAPTEPDKST